MPPRAPWFPALERVLSSRGDVRLAVLFGSAAKGRTHSASDLDVAVLPAGDPPLSWELALQADLERACGKAVDVVRIDRANPLLAWQIARDGVALREETRGAFRFFRAQAAIAHDELAHSLVQATETYRRAILAGRGGGRP